MNILCLRGLGKQCGGLQSDFKDFIHYAGSLHPHVCFVVILTHHYSNSNGQHQLVKKNLILFIIPTLLYCLGGTGKRAQHRRNLLLYQETEEGLLGTHQVEAASLNLVKLWSSVGKENYKDSMDFSCLALQWIYTRVVQRTEKGKMSKRATALNSGRP